MSTRDVRAAIAAAVAHHEVLDLVAGVVGGASAGADVLERAQGESVGRTAGRGRVLGIQGYDDEYGTMAQLDEIASRVSGPSEFLRLDYCGHSPFRDQPDKTLARITKFVQKILR